MSVNREVLKALNEHQGDFILSPYSFDQAVGGAMYVMGMSNKKPDMTPTDGIEEFNNWYSEQRTDSDDKVFEDRAVEVFKENRTKVSFSDKVETSDKVNSDCNEKTHGMIPSIVSPSDFNNFREMGMVGLVLNTIYLKQKWFSTRKKLDKFMFAGEETEGMVSETTEKANIFWYNGGPLVTMFLENGIRFHALMPKDVATGLSEKDVKFITNYVNQKHPTLTARIKMPFIKTDGNFSGVYEDENHNKLQVKQKAKIICDDKGVEAAAATAVLCFSGCSAVEEKVLEIVLDKPFFFFIEKDGKIFFVGKKVGSYLRKDKKAKEVAEALGLEND